MFKCLYYIICETYHFVQTDHWPTEGDRQEDSSPASQVQKVTPHPTFMETILYSVISFKK